MDGTKSALEGILKKITLITVVLIMLATASVAQLPDWNADDNDPMLEAIGLHTGYSGGFGLSYKFPVKWWLYCQLAGGIWNTNDHQRNNLGLSVQYVLRQEGEMKIFIAGSAAHFHHKDNGITKSHWNRGFGVGAERLIGQRTAVQAELAFTHRGNKDTIMLFPQVGLNFYF